MKLNLSHCTRLCLWLLMMAALALSCSPRRERPAPAAVVSPVRIISLSPSLSRQIDDLGRRDLLVGVTSFDDFSTAGIDIVGTLVQPNLEAIIRLGPDVVLISGEDGLVQNIDRLENAGVRICRFGRNRSFRDICDNYLQLAAMLGREPDARKNIARYSRLLERITNRRMSRDHPGPLSVAFFLSHRPLVAASEDSFIANIIRDAGGSCVYRDPRVPYPMVSFESLVESNPDLVIYMDGDSGGGAFFRRLSRDFADLKVVKHKAFYIVDSSTIPFYTPADYVKSVERVAEILDTAKDTAPPAP